MSPSSKRYISPEKVGEITSQLRNAKAVGVVQNPSPAELALWDAQSGVHYWQFHGSESAELMQSQAKPFIQVIGMNVEGVPQRASLATAAFHLYDTQIGKQSGGLGMVFPWEKMLDIHRTSPVWIAGGLNENNLQEAITIASPDGIDLNSGVEVSPGIKDLNKVSTCLRQVFYSKL